MLVRSFVLLLLALAVGCGGPPAPGTVQGKVTLNGADVDGGKIRFIPTGGGAPAEATITGGRYTIQVVPGEARVEIVWPKPKAGGAKKPPTAGPGGPPEETEEAVPANYNTRSELKHTVTDGTATKDFELKGKAK